MKGRFLLDVVVGQGTSVFQLFSGENETLLIRRNSFFVLDFGLDVFDAVGRFHFQGDRLTRQSLHEYLHLQGRPRVNGAMREDKIRQIR